MIECRVSDDVLLEADPAELAGSADTELSRHIAECQSCHDVAKRILAANRTLHDILGRASGVDVDRLLAEAALPPLDGAETRERRSRSRAVRGDSRPFRRLWAALAAAACIAALLLARQVDRRPLVVTPTPRVERHLPGIWPFYPLKTPISPYSGSSRRMPIMKKTILTAGALSLLVC